MAPYPCVFDKGDVISSSDWKSVHESYVRSILNIDHLTGSQSLKLRRRVKLPNGQWRRNGVGYLRSRFLDHMKGAERWNAEGGVDPGRDREQPPIKLYPSLEAYREPITSDFGGFDFVTTAPGGSKIAIEWETGNISSSHRSMNKLGNRTRQWHRASRCPDCPQPRSLRTPNRSYRQYR